MPMTSRYEGIAQTFLSDNPIGTSLSAERLLSWVEQKADGHAIRSDLTIEDPRKKVSTVRRHLNEGARTQNVAEDRRFIIQIEDPKRGSFVVVAYAQHAHTSATQAFIRSAGGAMAPINSALGILRDIKVDELPPEKKVEVEGDLKNLEDLKEPVRRIYTEEADRRMVTALIDRGQTEQQARALLASMSTVEPYQKLIRKLT